MGPSVIAASTTQFNVLVNSMFASTLGDGPIFWLSIAFRLMQLPLGLFGVALGTVTLPLLSRLVVAGDMDAFRGELARAMRLALSADRPVDDRAHDAGRADHFGALPARQIQRRPRRRRRPARCASTPSGLCGYAALKVLVNAFYALDQRKTPMLVSFLAVALNLLFNWIFTFRLGWGHRGLAFSTGCVASCNFLLLYVLMRRHLRGLETRRMLAHAGQGGGGVAGAGRGMRGVVALAAGGLGDAAVLVQAHCPAGHRARGRRCLRRLRRVAAHRRAAGADRACCGGACIAGR